MDFPGAPGKRRDPPAAVTESNRRSFARLTSAGECCGGFSPDASLSIAAFLLQLSRLRIVPFGASNPDFENHRLSAMEQHLQVFGLYCCTLKSLFPDDTKFMLTAERMMTAAHYCVCAAPSLWAHVITAEYHTTCSSFLLKVVFRYY
jgi:hypothetical protein